GKSVKRLPVLERRWVVVKRAAAVAVAVGVLAAMVTTVAVHLNRESKRADEDRQRQVGGSVEYATRAMEEGDFLGALPLLTEALRLDQGNPGKVETHRLRIG